MGVHRPEVHWMVTLHCSWKRKDTFFLADVEKDFNFWSDCCLFPRAVVTNLLTKIKKIFNLKIFTDAHYPIKYLTYLFHHPIIIKKHLILFKSCFSNNQFLLHLIKYPLAARSASSPSRLNCFFYQHFDMNNYLDQVGRNEISSPSLINNNIYKYLKIEIYSK